MIDLNNQEKTYKQPVFIQPSTQKLRRVVIVPLLMKEIEKDSASSKEITNSLSLEKSSIGKMSLNEFVENFESYRNELTEKKLRGKTLSKSETYELKILNNRFDELIGYEKSADHLEALDILKDAKRFLARRK